MPPRKRICNNLQEGIILNLFIMIAQPQISFTEACKRAFKGIITFNGRARRSEFWWAILGLTIIDFIVSPIGFMGMPGVIFRSLINLAITLVTLSLTFRRLHDMGRSGWFIGPVCLLVFVAYFIMIYSILQSGCSFADLFSSPESFSEELIESMNESSSLYFMLSGFIFILCGIWSIVIIVFCCMDSEPFENKYGPCTKYIEEEN